MLERQDVSKVYQRIGEFVVCFQWIEQRFREIGWMLNDPNRSNWPSEILREETNYTLLEKVKEMYFAAIESMEIENHKELRNRFSTLIEHAHEIRQYRNDLLHSAYIELKSFDEIFGLVTTNMKHLQAQKSRILSLTEIDTKMMELGKIALALNSHYIQIIHWPPK